VNRRGVNVAVVQRRLEEMHDLLAYLKTREAVTAADLRAHTELRLAVERALSQLVDHATSINAHVVSGAGALPPADYRSSFLEAARLGLIDEGLAQRLAPAAGLRNVLTHEYVRVDLAVVAAAVQDATRDFGEYVRAVAAYLQDRGAS
jgi:uncharacterized protein YutE (UPF0331/DUF86 family)